LYASLVSVLKGWPVRFIYISGISEEYWSPLSNGIALGTVESAPRKEYPTRGFDIVPRFVVINRTPLEPLAPHMAVAAASFKTEIVSISAGATFSNWA